jgi:hypothetical protein
VIVRFPDGTTVQATARGRPERDPTPDFGLYLDACWSGDALAWPCEVLAWPDYGTPTNVETTIAAIRTAFSRAGEGDRVEIGCVGGAGRTGTVLACMAILAGIVPPEAVAWVRANYRSDAIETPEQERFVTTFADAL